MSSSTLNQHETMRGRDVSRVARGEQAPRPPHEPGSIADSPESDKEEDGRPVIELRTAPTDFRFPTTNQTRHCYVRYLEYHRCLKGKDDEHRSECDKFQRWYRSLCPTDWVVEWNRQREEGIFPGPIYDPNCLCVLLLLLTTLVTSTDL